MYKVLWATEEKGEVEGKGKATGGVSFTMKSEELKKTSQKESQ